MSYKGLTIFKIFLALHCGSISNSLLASDIENLRCYNTATRTWAERQVSLLFETEGQATKRLDCLFDVDRNRKIKALDQDYQQNRLFDYQHRHAYEMIPENPSKIVKARSSAKFQIARPIDYRSSSSKVGVLTVRGYKSVTNETEKQPNLNHE